MINGIIGQNDEIALGSINAIKQSGLDIKKFSIDGIDGITDALISVKNHEMESILQDSTGQATGGLSMF